VRKRGPGTQNPEKKFLPVKIGRMDLSSSHPVHPPSKRGRPRQSSAPTQAEETQREYEKTQERASSLHLQRNGSERERGPAESPPI